MRLRITGLILLAGLLVGAGPHAATKSPLSGMPIRFDSEIIRIKMMPDSIEVEGIYQMLCRYTGMPQIGLFYPYPEDSLLGGARSLFLEARTPRGPSWPLEFMESSMGTGARWRVPLDRGDTLLIRTVYRQARKTTYGRYIVTTTSAWGRPLRNARFEITLPAGARDPEFSFPFELSEEGYYFYETTDFLPDVDIIVNWKPSP